MRGGYAKRITERQGTCGGCKKFVRRVVDGRETAGGKCEAKPGMWQPFQSTPKCKRYEAKGGGGGMSTPIQAGWRFECPVCGNTVFEDEAHICQFCGEPLDWTGEIPEKEAAEE